MVITEDLLKKYPLDRCEISEFNTKVVGTSFRDAKDIDAVEDDDWVLIVPEIDNPYDPFACMVIHDKTNAHIGYLSKVNSIGSNLSEEVCKNIKNGDLYVGKVETTGGTQGKTKGLNLNIRRLHIKG